MKKIGFFLKDEKNQRKYKFFWQIKSGKIISKQNILPSLHSKQFKQVETKKYTSSSKNKRSLFWMNSRFGLWLAKSHEIQRFVLQSCKNWPYHTWKSYREVFLTSGSFLEFYSWSSPSPCGLGRLDSLESHGLRRVPHIRSWVPMDLTRYVPSQSWLRHGWFFKPWF